MTQASQMPPLLSAVFGHGEGTVAFRGYYPYRGDDVPALLQLASVLPDSIGYVPVPPRLNVRFDARRLLQQMEAVPVNQDDGDKKSITDVERTHARQQLAALLRDVLGRAGESLSYAQALERLGDYRREPRWEWMLGALEEVVLHTEGIYRPYQADQRAMAGSTSTSSVTDSVPLLVIGRPEYYQSWPEHEDAAPGDPPTLGQILRDARYPGRFEFQGSGRSVKGARDAVLDRKTQAVYRRSRPETEEDYGVIYIRWRRSHKHPVAVAAGGSALGTYAACRLLAQRRPIFQDAIAQAGKDAKSVSIDILLHCRRKELVPGRPFPLMHAGADNLWIDVVNADDLLSYKYNHAGARLMHRLVGWRKGAATGVGDDPGLRYSTPAPGPGDCQRIVITATPRTIAPGLTVLASAPLLAVLDRVRADADADNREHGALLRRVRRAASLELGPKAGAGQQIRAMGRRPEHSAFRPVLIVGRTGVGKSLVARLVAGLWGGTTLAHLAHRWTVDIKDKAGDGQRTARLEAACDVLGEALAARLDDTRWRQGSPMATLSPVAIPSNLLDGQLYGVARDAATGVGESVGALQQAGTGTLFLDELFELPLEQQKRLLTALSDGRFVSVGSNEEFPFFARVVAATNRILDAHGTRQIGPDHPGIREDLVARFNRVYAVPRLRDRPLELIPSLLRAVGDRMAAHVEGTPVVHLRVSRRALAVLLTHEWPRNFRDLEAVVASLPVSFVVACGRPWNDLDVAQRRDAVLRTRHLSVLIGPSVPSDAVDASAGSIAEQEITEFVLEMAGDSWLAQSGDAPRDLLRALHAAGTTDAIIAYAAAIDAALAETGDKASFAAAFHQLLDDPRFWRGAGAVYRCLLEVRRAWDSPPNRPKAALVDEFLSTELWRSWAATREAQRVFRLGGFARWGTAQTLRDIVQEHFVEAIRHEAGLTTDLVRSPPPVAAAVRKARAERGLGSPPDLEARLALHGANCWTFDPIKASLAGWVRLDHALQWHGAPPQMSPPESAGRGAPLRVSYELLLELLRWNAPGVHKST